jgi:hypothetical protein
MNCPHCNIGIHRGLATAQITTTAQLTNQLNQVVKPQQIWQALHQTCPECHEIIIYLTAYAGGRTIHNDLAFPRATSRPIPADVPDPYRQDFIEACTVLGLSPKASAALSRRNLQAILRDRAATKSKDLYDQIEEVVASGKLPSHIEQELHAVRNIGNFAAHTIKSTSTGSIVDVEPGEAEWNLDVLESLFDFYFVQPAVAAKRKAELNKKLKDAGKPEIP